MRVTNIVFPNIYSTGEYKSIRKSGVNYAVFKAGMNTNCFTGKKMPFSKLKYFTIQEYKRLSEFDISKINELIDKSEFYKKHSLDIKEALLYHEIASTGIKDNLNNLFGCGNFIFIPLGRSLSSIGKCLGYKIGEDKVKSLPLSRAGRFIDMTSCKENIDLFCKYLDSIGLSKKEIETSGKFYVFSDFCDSGASMLGAKILLTSDKVFGNLSNLRFFNINYLLRDIEPNKITDNFKLTGIEFNEKLNDILCQGAFKEYSTVAKCKNLAHAENSLIKPKNYSEQAKIFWFKFLDKELRKRKLDILSN